MEDIELLQEFFTLSFSREKNKPNLILAFKKEKKKETNALRTDGLPYSTAQYGFFEHHINDKELSKLVYDLRKKLFNTRVLFDVFVNLNILSNDDIEYCKKHFLEIDEKTKRNHKTKMATVEVRQKISDWGKANSKISSAKIKQAWIDNRENYMKGCFSDDVNARRVATYKKNLEDPVKYEAFKKAMNAPERLHKISTSSKAMWELRKKDGTLKDFLPTPQTKSFTVNDVHMNKIEAIIANYLNECNINWVYEKQLTHNNSTYLPDFYLPESLTIIECFGDFWHANPNKYKETDVVFESVTAGSLWLKDNKKLDVYNSLGIKSIFIWENDILNNFDVVKKQFEEIK